MRDIKGFGQFIAVKRKKAGLTQECFATRLGITPQAVSKWENGIGYPDVTLFPAIAEALGVSIDELFLDRPNTQVIYKYNFPDKISDMAFVLSKGNKGCYSSKQVSRIDADMGTVSFFDGSTADIDNNLVFNKGQGEIRFFQAEPCGGNTSINEKLKSFSSLEISNNLFCDIKIHTGTDSVPRIVANGNSCFIGNLKYRVSGDILFVEIKNNNNESINRDTSNNIIEIYTDIIKGKRLKCYISGCGTCDIEPEFEDLDVSINGSGDICGMNCDNFVCSINGSGNIVFADVKNNAKVRINGSGDVKLNSAHRAELDINGSGNIEAGKVHDVKIRIAGSGDVRTEITGGDFNAKVLGSGEITASGEAETFYCGLQGNLSVLDGKELTVNYADIHSKGTAQIYLKAIKCESIEKVRPGGVLVVGKRGE